MKTDKILSLALSAFFFMSAGYLFPSCQKESAPAPREQEDESEEKTTPEAPDEADDCVIGAEVSVDGMTPADGTKSSFGGGKSKAQLDAIEKTINNMTVFQFYAIDGGGDSSGPAGTLKHVYYASSPAEIASFRLYGKSGATYNFYAIANVGDWSSKLTKQKDDVDDLKALTYVSNSISGLTASDGFPLVMNTALSLTFSGTSKLQIRLKHLTARVEIIVNTSALSSGGNNFAPTSLQILNANNTNCPFNLGGNKVKDASNLVTGDYTVGDDVTNLGNGTGVYFYCLENAQETPSDWRKSNTDPSKKIPANYGDFCTYVELKGVYTAANGRVSNNTYRVMLGENNTNDVKVLGGRSYQITLNLSATGAEAKTWKSECDGYIRLDAQIKTQTSGFYMADGTAQFRADLVWNTYADSQYTAVIGSRAYTGPSPKAYNWYSGDDDIIKPEGSNSASQTFSYGSVDGEVAVGVDVSFADRPTVSTPAEKIEVKDNRTLKFEVSSQKLSTDGTENVNFLISNYTGQAKLNMASADGFQYFVDGMSSPLSGDYVLNVESGQPIAVKCSYSGEDAYITNSLKSFIANKTQVASQVDFITVRPGICVDYDCDNFEFYCGSPLSESFGGTKQFVVSSPTTTWSVVALTDDSDWFGDNILYDEYEFGDVTYDMFTVTVPSDPSCYKSVTYEFYDDNGNQFALLDVSHQPGGIDPPAPTPSEVSSISCTFTPDQNPVRSGSYRGYYYSGTCVTVSDVIVTYSDGKTKTLSKNAYTISVKNSSGATSYVMLKSNDVALSSDIDGGWSTIIVTHNASSKSVSARYRIRQMAR